MAPDTMQPRTRSLFTTSRTTSSITDDDRVVVTGMGLVSCLGTNVDEFHEKLCRGTNGVKTIDRFDVTKYATKFGGQIDTNEFQQEVEKFFFLGTSKKNKKNDLTRF